MKCKYCNAELEEITVKELQIAYCCKEWQVMKILYVQMLRIVIGSNQRVANKLPFSLSIHWLKAL